MSIRAFQQSRFTRSPSHDEDYPFDLEEHTKAHCHGRCCWPGCLHHDSWLQQTAPAQQTVLLSIEPCPFCAGADGFRSLVPQPAVRLQDGPHVPHVVVLSFAQDGTPRASPQPAVWQARQLKVHWLFVTISILQLQTRLSIDEMWLKLCWTGMAGYLGQSTVGKLRYTPTQIQAC
jgi:hypothetical protein